MDLGIGNTIELKLEMQVSGLQESVEVTANSTTVDNTGDGDRLEDLAVLLFSMPISRTNAAVNLLNNAPGINSGSAYGGGANTGSSLMLDGVDTRDPEGGSAWTFFNYNIIEEVQVVGQGAAPDIGGFTGAVVNTITKSGGNRFSTLSEMRFTNPQLERNNINQCRDEGEPLLARSSGDKKLDRPHGEPRHADQEGQGVLLRQRAALLGAGRSHRSPDAAHRGEPALQRQVDVAANVVRQHYLSRRFVCHDAHNQTVQAGLGFRPPLRQPSSKRSTRTLRS